jgi:hypothetical protein
VAATDGGGVVLAAIASALAIAAEAAQAAADGGGVACAVLVGVSMVAAEAATAAVYGGGMALCGVRRCAKGGR